MGTPPIPRYLGDPDYYPKGDPRREAHLAHILTQRAINVRIDASGGDKSYAVVVMRSEVR